WGVEADVSMADIDGATRCAVGVYLCDAKVQALGTVTGRLGHVFGPVLLYGKAGGAWVYENFDMIPSPQVGPAAILQGKQWRSGWTAGAGGEYALSPALSARLEYNYLSFDGSVGLTDQTGTRASVQLSQQFHLVKLGMNYKLAETSPLARSGP